MSVAHASLITPPPTPPKKNPKQIVSFIKKSKFIFFESVNNSKNENFKKKLIFVACYDMIQLGLPVNV